MKKIFVLLMAMIVSVFVLIGCGSNQDAEVIAELQSTVDDLQNQVQEYSALQSELDSANNSIAELQTELDEMISKLEMLYRIEAVDETTYAVSDADIYDDLYGEVFGNEPAGTISAEQEIKITGKSALNWYEIELDGKKQYIDGEYLSEYTEPDEDDLDLQALIKELLANENTSTPSSGGIQYHNTPEGDAYLAEHGTPSNPDNDVETVFGQGDYSSTRGGRVE